jgi:hypothetical protein
MGQMAMRCALRSQKSLNRPLSLQQRKVMMAFSAEYCPKRAATLEAITDDALASRFDDSGCGTEKSRMKFAVAHPVTVCSDIRATGFGIFDARMNGKFRENVI